MLACCQVSDRCPLGYLFCLMTTVQKYLSKKGGRIYCLFVDILKAFDSICHKKLIKCLIRKGIGGNFLNAELACHPARCFLPVEIIERCGSYCEATVLLSCLID